MSLSSLVHKLPSSSSPLEELLLFSQIQLVVLDLDGTLLKTSDSLPGIFIHSLKNTIASDVKLTIATGRTLKGSSKILEKLKLSNKIQDATPSSFAVILYNGSLVVNPKNNNVIYHNEIPVATVNEITEVTTKYSANTFIYVVDSSTLIITEEMEKVYFIGASVPPKFDFNGMTVAPWNNKISNSATALLISSSNKNNKRELILELEGIKGISITSSGSDYIEIKPLNSSKASGMQQWISLPSVMYKQEEILAVGDNDNDVELLKWVGIGVAVNGASKAAIEASDYVTQFGAEQGVIEVLNLLKKAKRYKNIEKYFQ